MLGTNCSLCFCWVSLELKVGFHEFENHLFEKLSQMIE